MTSLNDHHLPAEPPSRPKDRHTPTPWRVGDEHYTDDDGWREIPIIAQSERRTAYVLGVCLEFRGLEPMQDANAAFIVRACNAHDDLLAALKDARNTLLIEHSLRPEYGFGQLVEDLIDPAIAKAEL